MSWWTVPKKAVSLINHVADEDNELDAYDLQLEEKLERLRELARQKLEQHGCRQSV